MLEREHAPDVDEGAAGGDGRAQIRDGERLPGECDPVGTRRGALRPALPWGFTRGAHREGMRRPGGELEGVRGGAGEGSERPGGACTAER